MPSVLLGQEHIAHPNRLVSYRDNNKFGKIELPTLKQLVSNRPPALIKATMYMKINFMT